MVLETMKQGLGGLSEKFLKDWHFSKQAEKDYFGFHKGSWMSALNGSILYIVYETDPTRTAIKNW